MRTTTQPTLAKIAALGEKPTKPAWLRAALNDALLGKPMSLERERHMCAALGIDVPPSEYAVPECPGCGGAPHVVNDGCGGHPVTAVVALAPGQAVTTRRPRVYNRIDQMPVAMLARAIQARHEI